jgi:APA family basic amino acid/polyamine antiporter
MGRDGILPSALGRLLPERGTPWVAALVVGVGSAAILPLGKVEVVAGLSSFAALLAFVAVNVALIRLRFTAPNRRRPFRVSGGVGRLPLLPVLALASLGLLLLNFQPVIYLSGGVALILGALGYAGRRWWSRSAA